MCTATPNTTNYEREVCGRCGGSGHYSYNQINGTRCFGCGGSGKRLTKRGRAAKSFADTILEIRIEDYAAKHAGRTAIYGDALTGKRIRFNGAEAAGTYKGKSLNGPWKEYTNYAILQNGERAGIQLGEGIKVRLVPTAADIAAINDYQNGLTQAGKPKKSR